MQEAALAAAEDHPAGWLRGGGDLDGRQWLQGSDEETELLALPALRLSRAGHDLLSLQQGLTFRFYDGI